MLLYVSPNRPKTEIIFSELCADQLETIFRVGNYILPISIKYDEKGIVRTRSELHHQEICAGGQFHCYESPRPASPLWLFGRQSLSRSIGWHESCSMIREILPNCMFKGR